MSDGRLRLAGRPVRSLLFVAGDRLGALAVLGAVAAVLERLGAA